MKKEIAAEFVVNDSEIRDKIYKPKLEALKEIKDFAERNILLAADVRQCTKFYNQTPKNQENQFWRRNLVRSVFVLLEACCFGLKRIVIHHQIIYDVSFSPAELALLKDEKYELNDKGEAQVKDNNFQHFIPNLRFALSSFAKCYGLPFALDMSQVPLKDFKRMRDRVTHPKQLSDLNITDNEIKLTETIANWFMKIISSLIREANRQTQLPRIPQFSPIMHWKITKDFYTMQSNGDVYQFDTSEQAQAYLASHLSENDKILPPILLRTEDLKQNAVPD